jgi:hypothetical protein
MVVLLSYWSGIRDLLFTLNSSVTICIHHEGITEDETEKVVMKHLKSMLEF